MEGTYFPARAGLVASHLFFFSFFLTCCDLVTCVFLLQILEVPVTARDVERQHHTQLKRWKKNRGELNFKPPPRMHGARLIMLAEPPRRQDLQQNPTIVLEVPQSTPQLKKSKKKSVKKSQPTVEIPNPYPLLNNTSPPPSDPPAPPPVKSKMSDSVPQIESPHSLHQQQAPLTGLHPAKESPLQQSTQSLSSSEQDTYL